MVQKQYEGNHNNNNFDKKNISITGLDSLILFCFVCELVYGAQVHA